MRNQPQKPDETIAKWTEAGIAGRSRQQSPWKASPLGCMTVGETKKSQAVDGIANEKECWNEMQCRGMVARVDLEGFRGRIGKDLDQTSQ